MQRAARAVRHSGVQKEVLALYRELLRTAARKGDETRAMVVKTFREDAGSVRKQDIRMVEYMIRQGKKKLKLLQMDSVAAAHRTAAK